MRFQVVPSRWVASKEGVGGLEGSFSKGVRVPSEGVWGSFGLISYGPCGAIQSILGTVGACQG